MTRRALRAAAVAAAVLALTGCAAGADPAWTPPPWPGSGVAVVYAPEPLDAAALDVTGGGPLTGWRLRDDALGVQGRVMLFSGADDASAQLLQPLRDAVAARSAAVGVAHRPQVFARGTGLDDRACARGSTLRPAAEVLADPALGPAGGHGTAVVCDIVAASGSVLGQRIRVVTGDGGAVTADDSLVRYADLAAGTIVDAAQLWAPDAVDALWDDVVDALRRDAGSLSLAPVAAPDDAGREALAAAMAGTLPAPDGSFVLTFATGIDAPELAAFGGATAPRTVAVAAQVAAPLLSPAGAAVAASAGAPFAPPAPRPAGRTPVDCALFPCVAMTYDDGPGVSTVPVLDAYRRHGGAATFFAMGEKAAEGGDLLRRMIAEGHLVENHTWNHPHLPEIAPDAVHRQIADTTAALAAQTGVAPTVFRPPYGQFTPRVLAEAGLPAILWDVDTFDWQAPSPDVLLSRAVDQPQPGSIVLQHDIQPVTGQQADAVLAGLRDRGFTPVTVAQLFGGSLPTSGVWHRAP